MAKVYPNGLSLASPGYNLNPPKRGDVQGWSMQAARRNVRFLQSVNEAELTGHGYAVTLTVRECPPDHEAWKRLRGAYLKRLERAGAIRWHWVTEWQSRGVPHLHLCVYFPESSSPRVQIDRHKLLRDAWLAIAEPYGAMRQGQHIEHINDALGWLKYLAKHASRGVGHYQRSPENVPPGWTKTGRVWGHGGDWPTREAMTFELDQRGWYKMRRIIRSYVKAQARAEWQDYRAKGRFAAALSALRMMKRARSLLKCGDARGSRMKGVGQWANQEITLAVLAMLAAQGHKVDQVE